MVGSDPRDLALRRIRPDSAEELAHLPLPALQVGAHDRPLLRVGKFDSGEMLASPPQQQIALACRTKIANPLRVPAGSDEIPRTLVGQQVDRNAPRLARLAASNSRTLDPQKLTATRVKPATSRLKTFRSNQLGGR